MPNVRTALAIASLGIAIAAPAQNYLVAPSSYATNDAPAYGWVPGASRSLRQQTLMGASHLTPMLGTAIVAIELRRNMVDEVYQGGTAHLDVTMSIAPHEPIECSNVFANNTGTLPIQVFSGDVTFPTSPSPGNNPVPWTTNNIVRIPLTTPYPYGGGTLCIDIVGTPIAGQEANWWMADLELEDIAGTTNDLGGGCGLYGGVDHEWSYVSRRSLVPGAHARFSANGTPLGLALACFGTTAPSSIPLSLILPAAPGCDLWLGTLDEIVPTIFWPPAEPADLPFGGEAEISFHLPNTSSLFGASLTTQWVDWSQMATSNAIEWTVASAMPTADVAVLDGDPTEATGLVSVYLAHVMRFEYQ